MKRGWDLNEEEKPFNMQASPPLVIKPYMADILQLIQTFYNKIAETKPNVGSIEYVLLTKMQHLFQACATTNPELNSIQSILFSINVTLRAMSMLSSKLLKPDTMSRFEQFSFMSPYQKLQRMIQFYCAYYPFGSGISRHLSASYSSLFSLEPISILCSTAKEEIDLLINSNDQVLNHRDVFSIKENNKIFYYLPVTKSLKKALSPIIQDKNILFFLDEMPSITATESLFFDLTLEGYQIYCGNNKNIETLRIYLEDFGFNLEHISKAIPPNVPGYDTHTQYLRISHSQIGKLLAIHFKTDTPHTYLNYLYSAKNLDQKRCVFFKMRPKIFEEVDADFYSACFKKFLDKKTYLNPLVQGLLSCVAEDHNFTKLDPRRYLGALLTLEKNYHSLTKEQLSTLPLDLRNALIGLRSELILPENDESVGVSRRLSRHFHQVYEALPAKAPYVLFTNEGCCFYFDSQEASILIAEQFKVHNIQVIWQNSIRLENEPDIQTYPYKLVVPPHYNHDLLYLGRFHPANIEIALNDAYGKQHLNFTTLFLEAHAIQPVQKKDENTLPKILFSFDTASLKNGEQIIQLKVQSLESTSGNMGHVIIVLDTSSSMAGKKMNAATRACVELIELLSDNTHITLRTFQATLLNNCQKSYLPLNWKNTILKLSASGNTPLVETLAKVAQDLSVDRYFVPPEIIKEATVILITDGEGNNKETAPEIKHALQTNLFRGAPIPDCPHGLGTQQLPNYTPLIIIPVGIGLLYKQEFIRGLGDSGYYHIREDDDNMQNDLTNMINSVKGSLGPKIGPIYTALFKDNKAVVTLKIEMMLPQTSRYFYVRVPESEDLTNLKAIYSVESQNCVKHLIQTKTDKPILEAFFKHQLDRLFNEFAKKANPLTAFTAPIRRGNNEGSLMFSPKENPDPFAGIQLQLDALENDMKLNEVFALLPDLQVEINEFRELFKKAKEGKLSRNTLLYQQAAVARGDRWILKETTSLATDLKDKLKF